MKKPASKAFQVLVFIFGTALTCVANRQFGLTPCTIRGPSMEPTLKPGQSYLVYAWDKTVTRGDIVIVEDGKQGEAVKRIVGLPGETVRIDGAVWINHCRLHEPYLQPRMHTYPAYQNASEEYLLSQRQYFVMGDNRLVSEDSRDYGPISYSQIRGKLHASVGWP